MLGCHLLNTQATPVWKPLLGVPHLLRSSQFFFVHYLHMNEQDYSREINSIWDLNLESQCHELCSHGHMKQTNSNALILLINALIHPCFETDWFFYPLIEEYP